MAVVVIRCSRALGHDAHEDRADEGRRQGGESQGRVVVGQEERSRDEGEHPPVRLRGADAEERGHRPERREPGHGCATCRGREVGGTGDEHEVGAHERDARPQGQGHVSAMVIKQYLDLGFSTLLLPMVDTAEQATQLVRAARYPTDADVNDPGRGIRGMAAARAARFGRYPNHPKEANTCYAT